jgi:hypothetical protein
MTKFTLLRSAAVGSIAALALAATAQAAPVKHHHHHAQASGDAQMNAELVAQVNALRAQVDALNARLDQQQAAQAQTAQVAQSAQAQASQAQSAAAMAEADVKRVPAEVSGEVAKATKPGWWGNTQVGGVVFANLSTVTQKTNGATVGPNTGTGFDIKRAYVSVDHKFNDVWSANITTDMQYSSALSATEFYVKKAYVQAKLDDALVFRFGAADMPWVPFAEGVYGYRYVDKTLIDRTGFGTSADWGVNANGKLAGGMINYSVSVVDGAGYKAPIRSNNMDIEGRVNLNISNFVLAVGGYDGKLGKDVYGGAPTPNTATRFNALAAWVDPKFRLGVEYFSANDWNSVTGGSDKANGESFFGSVKLAPEWAVFGRYDNVNLNTVPVTHVHENGYYNVGVAWSPTKIVDLALLYKHDSINGGAFKLGDVGGSPGGNSSSLGSGAGAKTGAYDEFGLFAQFRW